MGCIVLPPAASISRFAAFSFGVFFDFSLTFVRLLYDGIQHSFSSCALNALRVDSQAGRYTHSLLPGSNVSAVYVVPCNIDEKASAE